MKRFKFFIFLSLKIICLSQLAGNTSIYINEKDFSIKNAVYIIRNREGNVNLDNNKKIEFINKQPNLKKNFELIKNNDENKDSEIYYSIKDVEKNSFLYAEKGKDQLIFSSNNYDKNYGLWKIIPKINEEKNLIYYVQNKETKYYWELIKQGNSYQLKMSYKSNESLNKDNEFLFIELFQKVKQTKSDLLEKEPIDVFIKYIDLTDNSLNRSGIHQIRKDYDNDELKYSVRSILQNIPWINKIFIVMPNEKVKFFKPIEEISDKIVYVKDKDLLGFDSADIYAFHYNLYKLKKFGLSENFILMDDDYFIAKPINKNEMFYEEDGKIYPAIITSDYYEMNKDLITNEIYDLEVRKNTRDTHSPNAHYIIQKKAFLFIFDLFGTNDIRYGKRLIEPAFSHNAVPMKISDIEEIHQYIKDYYKYGNDVLFAKVRSLKDLQYQTLYWAYVKNKYNRKVYKISSEFYDLTQASNALRNNKRLFVINTSSRSYDQRYFIREKEVLEKLFPQKTMYEIGGENKNKNTDKNTEKNTEKNTNKKDNEKLIPKNFAETILYLIINKIKENLTFNPQKYLNKIDLEQIKNLKGKVKDNEYNRLLEEEMQYIQNLCFWHEIINFIMFIILFLMIVFKLFYKRETIMEVDKSDSSLNQPLVTPPDIIP